MPCISQDAKRGKKHNEQDDDPAWCTRGLVVVRLLRARYVWRNAHSPSSELGAIGRQLRQGLSLEGRVSVHVGFVKVAKKWPDQERGEVTGERPARRELLSTGMASERRSTWRVLRAA